MLGANSADDRLIFFLFFLKIGFDTSCKLSLRQFAWSVKSYFLGKIRKIVLNVVCWNFYPACRVLTLVLLNQDIPCFCKQCRSKSVGFWRSQLIWICTVCHSVCEFVSTTWINWSDWQKIRSGHGILIYSAGQELNIVVWMKCSGLFSRPCKKTMCWYC